MLLWYYSITAGEQTIDIADSGSSSTRSVRTVSLCHLYAKWFLLDFLNLFSLFLYFSSLATQQRKYTDPREGLNTFLKELFDAVKVGQLANEKMDWIRRESD